MYFIFDTETNGLPGKNRYFSAISIGYYILNDDMSFVEKRYVLFNRKDIPLSAWDKGAFMVHKITHHKSKKEGVKPARILPEIRTKMRECDFLVSHNFKFDIAAINATFKMFDIAEIRMPGICTMHISKLVFPKKSKGLKQTWERIHNKKFDTHFRHHNAFDDAKACTHLLHFFKKRGYAK